MTNKLPSHLFMRRAQAHAAAIAGLVLVPAGAVAAQVVLPPQSDISRQRVAPLPLPSPNYDFRIQSPEKAAVPRAVDEIEFSIASVQVSGATYFPKSEVDALFAPLLARKIVLQDLRDAAQKLEDRYRAEGFFLTRVFVPPQQVQGGVLQVQVLEGYIGDVFVDSPNPASTRLIETLMAPVPKERPAKFNSLERRMLLINDMPGLSGTTVLQQGGALGSSEILVSAVKVPNQYRATFSNTSSELIGPLSYSLGGTISQPFNRPGALDVTLSASGQRLKELRSVNGRYAMPLGARGIVGSIGGLVAFARPGGAVAALDVRSRVMSFNARLRFPIVRSRANSVYLDVGVALNRNKTSILGETLSDDRSTVAEATLSWQQANWLSGDTNVSLSLFQGLTVLGANDATAPLASVLGFEPRFQRLVYTLQRNQRIVPRVSAQLNVQGQYTTDRLASGETISFGGPSIGRGYDPSLIAGERGLGVAGELRYAVPYAAEKLIEAIQLYTFADFARATVLATEIAEKQTNKISSLGFGLRMVMLGRFNVDLQGAQARRRLVADENISARFNLNVMVVF
jgi:hemolysin activation/secretion protein